MGALCRAVGLVVWLSVALAGPAADSLEAIDLVGRSLTLETNTGFKSYKFNEFTEVKINGNPGKVEQLRAGMRISVHLRDPQTASRILAVGNPAPITAVSPSTPSTPTPAGRPPLGSAMAPPLGARKLSLELRVDGADILKVRQGELWIEHQSWKKPDQITVDGIPWIPVWDGKRSDKFTAFKPPLAPFGSAPIVVRKQKGRAELEVKERPSPANNQTLTLRLSDEEIGGATEVELRISW